MKGRAADGRRRGVRVKLKMKGCDPLPLKLLPSSFGTLPSSLGTWSFIAPLGSRASGRCPSCKQVNSPMGCSFFIELNEPPRLLFGHPLNSVSLRRGVWSPSLAPGYFPRSGSDGAKLGWKRTSTAQNVSGSRFVRPSSKNVSGRSHCSRIG
jgi:hypothetical protein